MPESITPLLAERLDVSEKRARSLLRTLLQELRHRAETDGVQLPELGTFQEQDGVLTFEPSPSLRRYVNQQYEGLSAEALTVAPSDAAAAGMAGADAPDAAPSSDAPVPAEAASDDSDARGDAPPTEPSRSGAARRTSVLVGALLLLIALGGVGWFVYNQTNVLAPDPGSTNPASSGQTAEQTAPPPDTTQDETPPSDSAAAPERDSTYAPNSWAIVVASRASRAAAEEAAERYRIRFDTVEVVSGTVNNETWYRVAIGWYDSEPEAEQALDAQAASLPSGAWTHRLR